MLTPRESVMAAVLAAVLLAWLHSEDEAAPGSSQISRVAEELPVAESAAVVVSQVVKTGASALQHLMVGVGIAALLAGLVLDWVNDWRRRRNAKAAVKECNRLADLRGTMSLDEPAAPDPDQSQLEVLLSKVHAIDTSIQAVELRLSQLQEASRTASQSVRRTL